MNHNLSTLIIAILLVFISACKKDSPQSPSSPDISYNDVASVLTVQQRASFKVEQYFKNTTDTIEVLFNTAKWLLNQQEVDEVYLISDYILEAHYKSGITSDIVLEFVDPSGKAYLRGGGAGSGSALSVFGDGNLSFKKVQEKIIENKKVMVFVPFANEFSFDKNEVKELIENSPLDLQVDIKLEQQADLDAVRDFSNYGLIVLNTHGMPGQFRVKTNAPLFDEDQLFDTTNIITSTLAEQQMQAAGISLSEIKNGEIKLDAEIEVKTDKNHVILGYTYHYSIWVTDKFIRKMPRLNEAVVFGNCCFSGYSSEGPNTKNLADAFKSIGAITYYGYARDDYTSCALHNNVALKTERSVYKRLLYDIDSTGVAHLRPDGTEWRDSLTGLARDGKPRQVMKMTTLSNVKAPQYVVADMLKLKHFLDPEYRYESPCGVFKDERDGEVYTTVCIGDQIWFAENLRYNAPGSKDPQFGSASTKGKLYDYNTLTNGGSLWYPGDPLIQGICPKGWHVPTGEDWKKLLLYEGAVLITSSDVDWIKGIGTENVQASLKLLSKYHWTSGTPIASDPNVNLSGFSAKGMEYGQETSSGNFTYKNNYSAYFWSSSPLGKQFDSNSNTWIYNYNIRHVLRIDLTPTTDRSAYDPAVGITYYYPCRCAKD